jgi:hypothetical protein
MTRRPIHGTPVAARRLISEDCVQCNTGNETKVASKQTQWLCLLHRIRPHHIISIFKSPTPVLQQSQYSPGHKTTVILTWARFGSGDQTIRLNSN